MSRNEAKSPVKSSDDEHRPTTIAELGIVDIDSSAAKDEEVVDLDAVLMPLGRARFTLVFTALLLGIFIGSMDEAIVSTALKSIVAELGHQELLPWVGSTYLLMAASFGTIYGKMADIFGRKWIFVFVLVVFELGSVVCGLARSMTTLIVGRAICGIGAGGIFSLIYIILNDIVSLREKGTYQGVIGALIGLSAIVGLVVGGALSDKVSWRWCFFVNVPMGALTVTLVSVFVPFQATEGSIVAKFKRIDLLGTLFLFSFIICLITPLQLGGVVWPWNSAQVIGLFAGAVLCGAIFAYVELRVAVEPIVPANIFINLRVPGIFICTACVGAAFSGARFYIPLFFQVVNGKTATEAGIQSIPLLLGLMIFSMTSGLLLARFGRYMPFFYIGPAFIVAGTILIAFLDEHSTEVQKIFYLLLFGVGVGLLLQLDVLFIQESVRAELVAIVTAVSETCFTLGGALGIAVMGTVYGNELIARIDSSRLLPNFIDEISRNATATGGGFDPQDVVQFQQILNDIPGSQEAQEELLASFNQAYKVAYLCILAYPLGIWVASLTMLKERR